MKKPKRTTTAVRVRFSRNELLEIRKLCLSEATRANQPGRTLQLAKEFETYITTGK